MDLTTEQDEAELVKKWLRENGHSVVLGLVIGISGIFGWKYYQDYRITQNQQTAKNFAQLGNLDNTEYLSAKTRFTQDNPDSIYAVNANLLGAAKAVKLKDFGNAGKSLTWVMQNAKSMGFRLLARLNLARVEINAGNYDIAIELLENTTAESFAVQYAMTLGEAYAKKGDLAKARELYNKAQILAVQIPGVSQLMEMKLNNLGG